MGDIYLELTIANIGDLSRHKEISFLVDTGATRAWIPTTLAEELGIESAGKIALELADS
ncbi:MAG: aspartyl protease family protein, partial [Chloroflexi bacterium]|nr:aspartyl protease family protein [Chloroflexota bacterium]